MCCPLWAENGAPGAGHRVADQAAVRVGRTAVKGGLVTDPALRADAAHGVLWAAWDAGLRTAGIIASHHRRHPRQPRVRGVVLGHPRHRPLRMGEHRDPTDRKPMTPSERRILLVVHARRDDTVEAAQRVLTAVRAAGAIPVVSAEDRPELAERLAPRRRGDPGRRRRRGRPRARDRPRRRRDDPARRRNGARGNGADPGHQHGARRVPRRDRAGRHGRRRASRDRAGLPRRRAPGSRGQGPRRR